MAQSCGLPRDPTGQSGHQTSSGRAACWRGGEAGDRGLWYWLLRGGRTNWDWGPPLSTRTAGKASLGGPHLVPFGVWQPPLLPSPTPGPSLSNLRGDGLATPAPGRSWAHSLRPETFVAWLPDPRADGAQGTGIGREQRPLRPARRRWERRGEGPSAGKGARSRLGRAPVLGRARPAWGPSADLCRRRHLSSGTARSAAVAH